MIYKVLSRIHDVHGKRILDLGCGSGRIGMMIRIELQNRTYETGEKVIPKEIIGIEIYDDYISFCKKHKIYDHMIKHDLNNPLPLPDSYFDIAVCSEVIEHMPKGEGAMLLMEIDRVLKPDGISVITCPNGHTEGLGDEYTQEKNKYQRHLSAWCPRDFKGFGYEVSGYGFIINKRFLEWLFAPVSKVMPQLSRQLLAVKRKGMKP